MVINRLYLLLGVCVLLTILAVVFSIAYSSKIKPKTEEPQQTDNSQAVMESHIINQ